MLRRWQVACLMSTHRSSCDLEPSTASCSFVSVEQQSLQTMVEASSGRSCCCQSPRIIIESAIVVVVIIIMKLIRSHRDIRTPSEKQEKQARERKERGRSSEGVRHAQAIKNELSKSWRKHRCVRSQSMNTNLKNQLCLVDASVFVRRVRILACVCLQDHNAERVSVPFPHIPSVSQPINQRERERERERERLIIKPKSKRTHQPSRCTCSSPELLDSCKLECRCMSWSVSVVA